MTLFQDWFRQLILIQIDGYIWMEFDQMWHHGAPVIGLGLDSPLANAGLN